MKTNKTAYDILKFIFNTNRADLQFLNREKYQDGRYLGGSTKFRGYEIQHDFHNCLALAYSIKVMPDY